MNKITRDLNTANNSYALKFQHSVSPVEQCDTTNPCRCSDASMKASLDYIGMINYPKVNTQPSARVQKSVQEFMKNPDLIEEKIAFQDDLIARGYQPQEAIEKTELFFKALKNADTYKN